MRQLGDHQLLRQRGCRRQRGRGAGAATLGDLHLGPGQREGPSAGREQGDRFVEEPGGARVGPGMRDLGREQRRPGPELLVTHGFELAHARPRLGLGRVEVLGPEVRGGQDQAGEGGVVGHGGALEQRSCPARRVGGLGQQTGFQVHPTELQVDARLLGHGAELQELGPGLVQRREGRDDVAQLSMGVGDVHGALGRPDPVAPVAELPLRATQGRRERPGRGPERAARCRSWRAAGPPGSASRAPRRSPRTGRSSSATRRGTRGSCAPRPRCPAPRP